MPAKKIVKVDIWSEEIDDNGERSITSAGSYSESGDGSDPLAVSLASALDRCGEPRIMQSVAEAIGFLQMSIQGKELNQDLDQKLVALYEAAEAYTEAWNRFDGEKDDQ